MKKTILVGLLVASMGLVAACGSSGSGGGGGGTGPSITNVSSLPKATSPMATEAAAQVVEKQVGLTKAATTGMGLQSTNADFFTPAEDKSRAACEMFNLVKNGVSPW